MTTDIFGNERRGGGSADACCGVLGRDWGVTAATPASAASTAAPTSSDEHDAAILAQEMNKLSVKERELVLDDIHGVAAIQEETPEFLRKCLQDLSSSLSRLPKAKRKALDRALFFKPSIQTDKDFKLMFLRADHYDATKAAKRMAKYFEEKLLLFGEDKLVKKLTLDDLDEEDMERLNMVGCIVLPHRDQAGRPIWFFDITKYDFDSMDSMCRCFWYQAMITLEDETAQLKGICDVAYCPGDLLAMPAPISKMSELLTRSGSMLEGLPCRLTTFQFCYNDSRVRWIVSHLTSSLGMQVRMRVRMHYGSDLEMQYSLMTFGISCSYLFHSTGDDGKRRQARQYLINRRQKIESEEEVARLESERKGEVILYPQPGDVLVGRGRPYQEYTGNQRLSAMVEAQVNKYRNTEDRFEKTCIIIDVVKTIEESGGRFLQRDSNNVGWEIASDKAAREKTGSAFRSALTKVNNDVTKYPAIADFEPSSRSAKRVRYDPSAFGGSVAAN